MCILLYYNAWYRKSMCEWYWSFEKSVWREFNVLGRFAEEPIENMTRFYGRKQFPWHIASITSNSMCHVHIHWTVFIILTKNCLIESHRTHLLNGNLKSGMRTKCKFNVECVWKYREKQHVIQFIRNIGRFHCEFYFVVSTSISHWFVNWIFLWVIPIRFQGNIFQINLIFFGIFNKCFSFCHNWFVMPFALFLSTALSKFQFKLSR